MRSHGTTHHKAKLTAEQVRVIRQWLSEKVDQRRIAKAWGVSQSTVSLIARQIT